MSKLSASALWLCVLLLVVSATLLSTAAGIGKFVEVSSESPNSGGDQTDSGLGASQANLTSYYASGIQRVDVGAFSTLYYDSGLTFYSSIDDDCDVRWETFEDGLFRSDTACTQFKAFRSLLIVAIVTDALLAFVLYNGLLLGCWPRPGGVRVAVIGYVALALSCLVPVAANVTSMALLIRLVFTSFTGNAEYGVSFRLLVAAFPLTVLAVVVFAAHCVYHAVWVNKAKQVDGKATEGVAMEVIKPSPATAVTATREDSTGSSMV